MSTKLVGPKSKASEATLKQMGEELDLHIMDCAKAEVATGQMWITLCSYIRTNQVPDDMVRSHMDSVGFKKPRISEVLRVCAAPPEVWEQYANRTLGFRKALALARFSADGAVSDVTPVGLLVAGETTTAGALPIIRDEEYKARQAAGFEEESGSSGVSPKSRCEKAAATIFKYSTKGRKWNSGDGWVLELRRSKKKETDPAQPSQMRS